MTEGQRAKQDFVLSSHVRHGEKGKGINERPVARFRMRKRRRKLPQRVNASPAFNFVGIIRRVQLSAKK
jgi:hypothetical protein